MTASKVSAIKALEDLGFGYKNIKVVINETLRREFKATQIDVTAEASAENYAFLAMHMK